MEEILRKLQRDASGSKYKAIKESCTWALGKRGRCAGAEGVRGDTCSRITRSSGPLGRKDCHRVWVMDVASEN